MNSSSHVIPLFNLQHSWLTSREKALYDSFILLTPASLLSFTTYSFVLFAVNWTQRAAIRWCVETRSSFRTFRTFIITVGFQQQSNLYRNCMVTIEKVTLCSLDMVSNHQVALCHYYIFWIMTAAFQIVDRSWEIIPPYFMSIWCWSVWFAISYLLFVNSFRLNYIWQFHLFVVKIKPYWNISLTHFTGSTSVGRTLSNWHWG